MPDFALRQSRREALLSTAAAFGAAALLKSNSPAEAAASSLPVHRINAVFGAQGTVETGGVLHFDFPRTDFAHTSLMGVRVDREIGFDSEITFQPCREGALVKWEICLLDAEVNAVMNGLFQARLNPPLTNTNALHNHFLEPRPEVKFLHGTALGHPVEIAQAIYQAVKNNSAQPFVVSEPKNTGLPDRQIAAAIGGTPSVAGRVLNVSVDRAEKGTELGVTVRPSSQNDSLFTFQQSGNGAAVVAEFVLLPEEVAKVISVITMAGFKVTALHNHEIVEQPNFYYLHSFNVGDPIDMANAIHLALRKTGSEFA